MEVISINNDNILFELNGGKPDAELITLIDTFSKEMENISFKQNYKIYNTDEVSDILIGNDINSYAKDSKQIAVFIITLSHDVDKKLRYLEKMDKLQYLVYDKVCSHYIEDLCQNMQDEIKTDLLKHNKYMLNRYSTGYGDFPINVNKDIHKMLNADRLGIFLTDKNMFIPSKTISGIIASGDVTESFNFCKTCNITKDCNLIKSGRRCYE